MSTSLVIKPVKFLLNFRGFLGYLGYFQTAHDRPPPLLLSRQDAAATVPAAVSDNGCSAAAKKIPATFGQQCLTQTSSCQQKSAVKLLNLWNSNYNIFEVKVPNRYHNYI